MTLDQIFMLLADKKVLRAQGRARAVRMESLETMKLTSQDGLIAGVARDGTKIKAVIKGKSLARQLMEKAEAEAKATPTETPRQRRQRRRAERAMQREQKGI